MENKKLFIAELLKYFKKEMYLGKWDIRTEYVYMPDANMSCGAEFEYIRAIIKICKEYLDSADEMSIARVLLHEMCHISLSSIDVLIDEDDKSVILLERAT